MKTNNYEGNEVRFLDDFIILNKNGIIHLPRFSYENSSFYPGVLFGSLAINTFPYNTILSKLNLEYPHRYNDIIIKYIGRLTPDPLKPNIANLDGFYSVIEFDDIFHYNLKCTYHNSITLIDSKFIYSVRYENTDVVFTGDNATDPWKKIIQILINKNPTKEYEDINLINGLKYFGLTIKDIYNIPLVLYNMMDDNQIIYNQEKGYYISTNDLYINKSYGLNTLIFKKRGYYYIRIYSTEKPTLKIEYNHHEISFLILKNKNFKYIIQNSCGEACVNTQYSNIYRIFNKAFFVAINAIEYMKDNNIDNKENV